MLAALAQIESIVCMGVNFAAEHKALIKELNYSEYSADEVVLTSAQLEILIARVFKIREEFFIK